jgi:hypothetical protein
MGYWELVEPHWDRVSLDDERSFLRDYSTMPEASRHLLSAHWLYSEVCNGGFQQFFTNSTGVLAPEAIEGLRALDLAELADTAADAMDFFPAPYPRDPDAREALIDSYYEEAGVADEDAGGNPFVALDERFFAALDFETSDRDRFVEAADAYAATSSERT